MRLYLSSFDVGNRPEELVALAGLKRRTAVIVNALDNRPEGRAVWLTKQSDKLSKLGLAPFELDLRDYFGDSAKLDAALREVDVVWINGGNTFILRRAMLQSGFDVLIKSAVARDAIVYAGFSAGAVIVGPSLRGLEFVDDPNDCPAEYAAETVWDGLGFLPFAVAVHFKSDHSESEAVDREVAFYEANKIPYRTLRDGEALIIHGERQEIVS